MGWTWKRTSASNRGAPRPNRERIFTAIWACGLLWCVLGISSPGVAEAQAGERWRAKIGRRLEARLGTASTQERIRFSVVLEDPGVARTPSRRAARRRAIFLRQQSVLNDLAPGELGLLRRYENLSGFSGSARPAIIRRLAQNPDVAQVYVDGEVHKNTNQGRSMIGVAQAAAAGFQGAGLNVAVLDSGIDTDHPDLVDHLVDERCWCRSNNFNPSVGCCPAGGDTQTGPGAAEDDDGHGTSVSGIITSNGTVASSGVAPSAGIVAVKVLDASGGGRFSDIAAALDWLVANHVALNVRVVNMSLGDGDEYSSDAVSPCSGSNTANAIADLTAAGVAVFVASGNDGHTDGISFPACVADAISVGGVYDAALGNVSWCGDTCSTTLCTDTNTAADDFVCHTNSDELLDVLAPDYATATSGLAGSATIFGGTSAASPYAASLGLLLIEQALDQGGDLSVSELRTLMKSHGPMVTNSANGLSHRRTDVTSLFAICGNGSVELGEECDDGGTAGGDCCSASCLFEGISASCSDGDACTVADGCDGAGQCVAGAPLVCDDGSFCNGLETCDSGLGCQSGVAPSVDDGVACTSDACDEATDTITHQAQDAFCDDATFCNGDETCDLNLGCQLGAPPVLNDGVACTTDLCDEALNVVTHLPVNAQCDDGFFCNGSELCDPLLDCQAGSPPVVDDGVVCTADLCDEAIDQVVHSADNSACDDGAFCNGEEVCDLVQGCQSGVSPSVDDGVSCTQDSCDEVANVIVHAPLDAACDDGAFCNGAESCDLLLGCQSGASPEVDDGVGCTLDECDEGADLVNHVANDAACDDGFFCNGSETCDLVLDCQSGSPPELDDEILCTEDSCDEEADLVVHAAADSLCDDGAFCNGAEICDLTTGCQSGLPPGTQDGVACTMDSCDESTDTVIHTPDDSTCDDSDVCTVGVCDAVAGCVQVPVPECIPPVPLTGPTVLIGLVGLLLGTGLWSMRRLA
ncbi:MAG: S8 family serine peptidase [Myxococcota bacterium]|nr:S8 family serine peptidase [Myxococcota bacterium]